MRCIASGGSELDDDSSSNTSKRKKRENRTPLELKFEQYIRTAFITHPLQLSRFLFSIFLPLILQISIPKFGANHEFPLPGGRVKLSRTRVMSKAHRQRSGLRVRKSACAAGDPESALDLRAINVRRHSPSVRPDALCRPRRHHHGYEPSATRAAAA